ncbi:MAG: NfeD family protein, partial [Thermoplasmata archaeon]
FLLFAMYKVLQARRAKPFHRMIGEEAEAIDGLKPGEKGYVLFEGEMWKSESGEEVAEGETVYILAKDGPTLTVSKSPPGTAELAAAAVQGFLPRLVSSIRRIWRPRQ